MNGRLFYNEDGSIAYPARVGCLEAILMTSDCVTSGSSMEPRCTDESIYRCGRCRYEEYLKLIGERDLMIFEKLLKRQHKLEEV